jgi:hypothetical protein
MGKENKGKTSEVEPAISFREKSEAKKAAKRELQQKRLDDYFEIHSELGDDNLRQFRSSHPLDSPMKLSQKLKNSFVEAYCNGTSDVEKKDAIELYTLTLVALYGSIEPERNRLVVLEMEKSFRSIGHQKVVGALKKVGPPLLSLAVLVANTKSPDGSRIRKAAGYVSAALPFVKGSKGVETTKPTVHTEQDVKNARRIAENIAAVLGRIPKSWD